MFCHINPKDTSDQFPKSVQRTVLVGKIVGTEAQKQENRALHEPKNRVGGIADS